MSNQTYTYELIPITPLHVGDGNTLQSNLDFTVNKFAFEVRDLDAMFRKLYQDNPKAFAELNHLEFDLGKFISTYKIKDIVKYSLPLKGSNLRSGHGRHIKEVRSFVKNGLGQPYLPGSSLKGAIYTDLLVSALQNNHALNSGYKELERQIKQLFGDPQQSRMRAIQVSDTNPLDFEQLGVYELKIFNLKSETEAGWKSFSTRQNIPDFRQATSLYVEAVCPEVSVYGQIKLDRFLFQTSVEKLANLKGYKFNGLPEITAQINQCSLDTVKRELDFLQKFSTHLGKVIEFYEDLEKKIKGLDENSCILRMSWGVGWKGMTGDWLRGTSLERIRREAGLGKIFCPDCDKSIYFQRNTGRFYCRNCEKRIAPNQVKLFPIFPKTRRFALKDGIPSLPMGWVELRFLDKDVFYKFKPKKTTQNETTVQASRPVQPKPKVDPEKERKEKLERFIQNINLQKFGAEINTYLEQIKTTADEKLKQDMCKYLLDKAKSLPNKKQRYDKALKQNKKWALQLKNLAEKVLGQD